MSNCSIWPNHVLPLWPRVEGPYHVLPLWVRVEYWQWRGTPHSPTETLPSDYLVLYPGHTLVSFNPLQRCSQCILQPQSTGQGACLKVNYLNESDWKIQACWVICVYMAELYSFLNEKMIITYACINCIHSVTLALTPSHWQLIFLLIFNEQHTKGLRKLTKTCLFAKFGV